ncbi:hypothetical protein VTN00DRAFT_8639 [Thermoascus crustaceus]|uniref:uncharacterized protein n=1 Tax=Thermoascus crustaceus TaxID=5088 RepID=UPI0037440E07
MPWRPSEQQEATFGGAQRGGGGVSGGSECWWVVQARELLWQCVVEEGECGIARRGFLFTASSSSKKPSKQRLRNVLEGVNDGGCGLTGDGAGAVRCVLLGLGTGTTVYTVRREGGGFVCQDTVRGARLGLRDLEHAHSETGQEVSWFTGADDPDPQIPGSKQAVEMSEKLPDRGVCGTTFHDDDDGIN